MVSTQNPVNALVAFGDMLATHLADDSKFVDAEITDSAYKAAVIYLSNYKGNSPFLVDMQGKRNLSIPQARGVLNSALWERKQELRRAEQAEANKDLPLLVAGRRALTGTVKSTKWVENDFGGALKMLVELTDGNRVWGSVPAALRGDKFGPRNEVEPGAEVTFTATVTVSPDDPHFGFFSRPK